MPRLALIHTVAGLVPVFRALCRELLPDVETSDLVDEPLLSDTIRAGALAPATMRRLVAHAGAAEDAGADAVLVTCSSMGPAIDAGQALIGVPLLRVDEPMAERAVTIGRRIGVAATVPATLGPTADLVGRRAREQGRDIELRSVLVEGAFAALASGDVAVHDALVREAVGSLAAQADVVVLAQASMARVVAADPSIASLGVPVLASPRLAVERVARLFAGDG